MAQPSGHAKVWVWAMPALASALGVAGSAVSTAHAWHLRLFFFLFWCCSPLWPRLWLWLNPRCWWQQTEAWWQQKQSAQTRLVVPEGTASIMPVAYRGRADIREVVLPDSVIAIEAYAFHGCRGVTTLHLPAGLKSIGEYAFYGCTGILEVHLPDGLEFVGYSAFAGCTGITTLHLPEGLGFIGDSAFHGCSGITSLQLPAGPTSSIGHHAFNYCRNVKHVLVPDDLPAATLAGAFKNCAAPEFRRSSEVPLLRRDFWHTSMHTWCTRQGREAVLAVLITELRVDERADAAAVPSEPAALRPLAYELWLLILTFVPRHELGASLA